ncbi:MAG: hypothetical protein ACLGSD_09005 [Acidobacteriota bacterium]
MPIYRPKALQLIPMPAISEHKDRISALKVVVAMACLVGVVIYCSFHPGEWWKVLLKAIFSP